jgi:hypothetical protein
MMITLSAVVLGQVAFPILAVVTLILAVVVFALCKKDYVKAGVWARSCGFILEAQNGCSDKTPLKRAATRKRPPQLP